MSLLEGTKDIMLLLTVNLLCCMYGSLTTNVFHVYRLSSRNVILMRTFTVTVKPVPPAECMAISETDQNQTWLFVTYLRYQTEKRSFSDLRSFLGVSAALQKSCCLTLMCGFVGVWMFSGCCAAVLRLVDTALPPVSASGLHFCRLGRLPDSCFGIALRLLFPSEAIQVSSSTSSPLFSLFFCPCLCSRSSLSLEQHLCMSVLSAHSSDF